MNRVKPDFKFNVLKIGIVNESRRRGGPALGNSGQLAIAKGNRHSSPLRKEEGTGSRCAGSLQAKGDRKEFEGVRAGDLRPADFGELSGRAGG